MFAKLFAQNAFFVSRIGDRPVCPRISPRISRRLKTDDYLPALRSSFSTTPSLM